MAHSVQSTIGNPDRSLFHHGLIKILIQHQLSLSCKSWDEFLVGCKLGPTQYWPNHPPKTRRKRKAPSKSEVDDILKAELGDIKLQEASSPVDTRISNEGTIKVNSCYAETNMDQSLSDKRLNTPAKVDGKLTNDENVDAVNHENPSDLCTSKKLGDESMRKHEKLAQVCCDKGILEPKGFVFVRTRRFTRSMNTTTTVSVLVTTQQNARPVVVQLEDDVSSLIPETTHMD